ncbi:LssY C-terminal domain-containing protein [Vibrio maerlii]|uniref:LssY C-terminal domain-containing protein n=1 Tax=Vibrio maerlii TaxID=2231648 RepID=UPI000E3E933D|nr:LssY C-terminal domain-containing protein [Vibrio maerlii]
MFEPLGMFIGALLDALIGPNLFVPGEPFLIAAGYQLHQGIFAGLIAVLAGGWLGDQLSYSLGKKLGARSLRRLTQWQPKTRRPIARSRKLMSKKGTYVLLFARLLGPVAWVVPFIAGVHKVEWRRFTLLSSIGLVLGVGQFVVWGYLLSYGIEAFPALNQAALFVGEHLYSLMVLAATLAIFVWGVKRQWSRLYLKTALVFTLSALVANYIHFFWRADDIVKEQASVEYEMRNRAIAGIETISPSSLKAYPGRSLVFDAQAMNIVFKGESPKVIMEQLGWIENQTFSRNDIQWTDYLQLLKDATPPVSDLYWQDRPQEMAFQLPGNLTHRSHIRWWQAGVDEVTGLKVWVGALSYDNGLTLTPYSGIVTVLHSIDPDVDKERDRLAEQLVQFIPNIITELKALKSPVEEGDEEHDYFTDGQVLVINYQSSSI